MHGCDSAFRTSSDLKRHQRVHSRNKAFNCRLCSHSALSRSEFCYLHSWSGYKKNISTSNSANFRDTSKPVLCNLIELMDSYPKLFGNTCKLLLQQPYTQQILTARPTCLWGLSLVRALLCFCPSDPSRIVTLIAIDTDLVIRFILCKYSERLLHNT